MSKQVTRYEIREFRNAESYSVRLGRRLRQRNEALRTVRWLNKSGRQAFIAPLRVSI